MDESTGVSEFSALGAEVDRVARDIASAAKLKIARAFSPSTTKAGDATEQRLMAIRDQMRAQAPARYARVANTADRLLVTFKGSAQFANFKNINPRALGAIESVPIIPKAISATRAGELIRDLTLSESVAAVPGVGPQGKTNRLQVRQHSIHCHDETDFWDEPSSSDEIVLGVNWIAPTGATGYRWWRRTDFDEGETKSVDWTFSWNLPPKGKQQYFTMFTMIEEDWDNAAHFIEQTYLELKPDLHAKAEKFAAWLAGEIGWVELGPIIANILKAAIDYVFGWLASFFGSNVMGRRNWTFTLYPTGDPKWKSTGSKILPMPMNFKALGGHYSLKAEAILS